MSIYRDLIYEITKKVLREYIIEGKGGGFNYANQGDEFYTQENDIAKELSNYDLNGMVIYCNCDNPTMSNFYKFFKSNFKTLGLRGLYATYYSNNPMMFYFNGSQEKRKKIQSGRFQDNAAIMKKCDIVITNPPFSGGMPMELINMARGLGKHIIMVGPLTLANQKEAFEMIRDNQLNMGYTTINRFVRPDKTKKNVSTAWWTTLPVKKPMYSTNVKYNPSNYQKYDDYDAIDIDDYRNMPDDYYGNMGVSSRMLRQLNRNQFDVIDNIKPKMNGNSRYNKYIVRRKAT